MKKALLIAAVWLGCAWWNYGFLKESRMGLYRMQAKWEHVSNGGSADIEAIAQEKWTNGDRVAALCVALLGGPMGAFIETVKKWPGWDEPASW